MFDGGIDVIYNVASIRREGSGTRQEGGIEAESYMFRLTRD